MQSKLEDFAILKYTKKEEQVAITLNKNILTCGKTLYQTGISDVYVVLIEDSEEFLDNEKLQLTNNEESTIYEAELRGALKPRKNEKRCCEELAVWSGDDYTDPAFMKPISREVTKVCTPRICNDYNNPWYNIGTSTSEKWTKIEDGEIIWTNKPQEFEVTSHSKEEQLEGRRHL